MGSSSILMSALLFHRIPCALEIFSLYALASSPTSFPWPFVWGDVAVVSLASMLILAVTLLAIPARLLSQPAQRGFSIVCWGMGAAALGFLMVAGHRLHADLIGFPRSLVAAVLAGSLVLPVAWIIAQRSIEQGKPMPLLLAWSLLGMIGGVAVPVIYTMARSQRDLSHLQLLLEKSRLGEASDLSQRLVMIDPTLSLRGKPLHQVAKELNAAVKKIESTISRASETASPSERFEQARLLAILGRPQEALDVLNLLQPFSIDTWNLMGTIHETCERWQDAERCYQEASRACEQILAGQQRSVELSRALTGIAYSQRKQGHYAAAEAIYQQLWHLNPTADTSFLLAQFYEDTQQTRQALKYAQMAMSSAPQRYRESGRQLIQQLKIRHFGCFQVSGNPD